MSDPRADLIPPAEIRRPAAILADLAEPTPDILTRVLEGLRAGIDPETIARVAWIDRWFVDCLGEIEATDRAIAAVPGGEVPFCCCAARRSSGSPTGRSAGPPGSTKRRCAAAASLREFVRASA